MALKQRHRTRWNGNKRHKDGREHHSGSTVIIPDPKLSRWIQSFYSLLKVIISDPKLLLRIQTYYFGSKVIIPDPKLLLWIQSYYSGSKLIIPDPKVIIPDPKLLLWIQSYCSGYKVQYYSRSKVFLRNCKFGTVWNSTFELGLSSNVVRY